MMEALHRVAILSHGLMLSVHSLMSLRPCQSQVAKPMLFSVLTGVQRLAPWLMVARAEVSLLVLRARTFF